MTLFFHALSVQKHNRTTVLSWYIAFTQWDAQLSDTMQHDIRLKRTKSLFFSILQHTAQLAPTGLLESTQAQSCCYSTETHHALFTFLAKCVTHVAYKPIRSCLSAFSSLFHGGAVVAQRSGWDRPVKEERQTLMNGPQQEELSSGLQQQDAIWPKSRQLPEINAIPSDPLSLFYNNNSLSSSLVDKPRFPSYFCSPFPALLTLAFPPVSLRDVSPLRSPYEPYLLFSICLGFSL